MRKEGARELGREGKNNYRKEKKNAAKLGKMILYGKKRG